MAIAKVLIEKRHNLKLSYSVPEKFLPIIKKGIRVQVPLQKGYSNAIVTSIDINKSDKMYFGKKLVVLKPIYKINDDRQYFSNKLLDLAHWIADYYNESIDFVIKSLMPFDFDKLKKTSHKIEMLSINRDFLDNNDELIKALYKKAPKQSEIIDILKKSSHQSLPLKDFTGRSAQIKSLIKKNIIRVEKSKELSLDKARNFGSVNIVKSKAHLLNKEQNEAFEKISESIDSSVQDEKNEIPKPILLFGVTGSGKTEIFLQAIDKVLKNNQQVLYLCPEINLANQVKHLIESRFVDKNLALLHSQMSQNRRMIFWKQIQEGLINIVLGTRSALFAPLNSLGLIIVDEEHDLAYKQDFSPRYNARDIATVRANFEKCPIILASATPSIETFYNATSNKYELCTLEKRVDTAQLPLIRLINLVREPALKTHKLKILSQKLIDAIRLRLEKSEQVILFINKRGFASYIQCTECGESVKCEQCSSSLRFHKSKNILICHLCNKKYRKVDYCQKCHCYSTKLIGYGTEKVLELISKVFPLEKVLRLDTDIKDSHKEQTLMDFRKGKAKILIGTQMIAKGFHFPNVTLVGVLNADQGLNMPDFRCNEKIFQLLTQVSGRSGRGENNGEVYIQTFKPHSSIIQYARRQSYRDFAEEEIEIRKQFNFSPFIRISLLKCYSEDQKKGEETLQLFHDKLSSLLKNAVILGKVLPSPIEKIEKKYRFQVLIKTKSNKKLVKAFKIIKSDVSINKNIKVFLDIDCLNFM